MNINPFAKRLALGIAVVAAIAPAAVIDAGNRPHIDFTGSGSYSFTEFGHFAAGTGDAYGDPFDGTITYMLNTDDGTLPVAGVCEGGGANFALTSTGGRRLWGVSIGDVCGQYVDETNAVTHVFLGQYSVAESKPRLADTEGWIEIRLATGNRMSITLFDS